MTLHSINEAFQPFPKVARLAHECTVTEKIDGTNGQILVQSLHELSPVQDVPTTAVAVVVHEGQSYAIFAGSRSRWLQPGKATDNFGFAAWVRDNAVELVKLGPGRHFGEWWGQGIQRGYGLGHRRFSLFNTSRWVPLRLQNTATLEAGQKWTPACCDVVPVIYRGEFNTPDIDGCLSGLLDFGSLAAPGFDSPEGIIVYHTAANIMFKRTIIGDDAPKSVAAREAA